MRVRITFLSKKTVYKSGNMVDTKQKFYVKTVNKIIRIVMFTVYLVLLNGQGKNRLYMLLRAYA